MKKLPVLAVLGILPLIAYPILFGLAILSDITVGDRSFIFSVTYDSLHKLLMIILTDWYASLPVSYIIVLFMLLPTHLVLQRLHFSSGVVFVLLASLGAWVFSRLFVGPGIEYTVIFISWGAILASLFHVGMWGIRVLNAKIRP